ncbi:MAG: phosphoribosylformylglycinamidine synthase, partial [Sinobacterium sp.]|nr:phosphoribosylformylglycinamidine synthase [Sinobacterium sp.]
RYTLAVRPENLALFESICERERCPYSVVGEALEEQHLIVTDSLFDNKPVDLPMDVLFGKPPKMHRTFERQTVNLPAFDTSEIDLNDAIRRVLQIPAVASKQFLITIGDRSVTGQVVRDQMVGPWQVPVADVAVTTAAFDTFAGEAMSMGERTPLALISGPASGRMAVAESLMNIAAAPIEKLSDIKMSANWMSAAAYGKEDEELYDTVKAVGMELCPSLDITIPVGKDSMSMRTVWEDDKTGEQKSVTSPMSLVITAFAPVTDVRQVLTPQLQLDQGDSRLIFIDCANEAKRMGGSCLAQAYQQLGNEAPDLDDAAQFKAIFDAIQSSIKQGLLKAYHDKSDGGLLVTLAEMGFAAHCGFEVDIESIKRGGSAIDTLFNEELGAVVQVLDGDVEAVQNIFADHGVAQCLSVIGKPYAGESMLITEQGNPIVAKTRAQLQKVWTQTSFEIQRLRDNPDCAQQEFDKITQLDDKGINPSIRFDAQDNVAASLIASGHRPKMAILREQGVNGQNEMAAAFDHAGFTAIDVHMSDLLSGRVNLADFKGLVACGGFSYGDVLGAGEGWAKTVLYNTQLREQFKAFFHREDTFTLGVCNGCQMLSQLKDLIPGADHWPKFVRNHSEQFEARYSQIEIVESASILLKGMEGSVVPVAVAHGEGRVEFADTSAQQQGVSQLAARFVDSAHAVASQYPDNPNGSPEGMTSFCNDDGRVTIMMPHPERVFRTVTHSWAPSSWGDDSPWMRLFRNARVWVG